jgi:hypothetical protein
MHEQKEEFREYLRPQKIGQMGHSNYWLVAKVRKILKKVLLQLADGSVK